jgi:hypothetical protein
VVALLLTALLAACGGGDDEPAPGAEGASAAAPEPPDAERCAAEALRTSVRPGALVPGAGTYEVAVRGTSTLIEAGGQSRPEALPRRGKVVVTPARSFGNVRCFTTQTIRGPLRTDATFAVRGEDIYLTASEFDNGASRTSVAPSPPILAVRGGELEWSGTFSGPTRGTYRASAIGRRTMTVGGERVRVVGISSQTSFDGEQRGTDDSTRWVSLRDNLVVLEEAASEISSGGDRLRLRARTQLLSLRPSSGP